MTPVAQAPRSARRELGSGVYGLGDLRAYLALSGRQEDASHALSWLTYTLNPVEHQPRNSDYSFSDLISLFVVRELLKKGVHAIDIRKAEDYLRRKWGTDRPYVSDRIQTDGRHVFVDDDLIPGQIESADEQGQQAMIAPIKDYLTRVHYHDGTAAYWTPAPHVLVDPRVQFGEPVVEGTRVPTEAVADVAAILGVRRAAKQLGIPHSAAKAAVTFEQKLLNAQK
jgi:uncharacterized protein (DUF433 family)